MTDTNSGETHHFTDFTLHYVFLLQLVQLGRIIAKACGFEMFLLN